MTRVVEDEAERLAYPIPELARKLGVNRRTVERRIADGTFKIVNLLGRRLVTAESVKALFSASEAPSPARGPDISPTHP